MSEVFIAIISIIATLIITKRQFLIEDRTIVAIKSHLNHKKWEKRTFNTIKEKIKGFDDDELRKILVASGAVCFNGKNELWGFQYNKYQRPASFISKIVILLIFGCLYIFYSGTGLLFSSYQIKVDRNDQESLNCTYFTGLSIEKRKYWYSSNGMMGKSACPRTINLE